VYLRSSSGLAGVYPIIKKNGSINYTGTMAGVLGGVEALTNMSALVQLNGTTDYVTAGASFSAGTGVYVESSGSTSVFSGCLMRAA